VSALAPAALPPPAMETRSSPLLLVVPTYQEIENIDAIVSALAEVRARTPIDVLVVDDGSPDGTADRVRRLQLEHAWLHLLERPAPAGLGSAYRDGFCWALDRGYARIGEMDADLSHDPATIPALVEAMDHGATLAIGSRYVLGGGTTGWPLRRRLLSRGANLFARTLLALPVHDVTAGFRIYDRDAARLVAETGTHCNGYGFQVEAAYAVARAGGTLVEVPITFHERVHGCSKISRATTREATRTCFALAFADATCRRRESRRIRLALYLLIGATGLLVNQAVLWRATEGLGFHYLVSAIIATQVSSLWNFGLTERFVFDAGRDGRFARLISFFGMNNAWMAARAPLLVLLTSVLGIHYMVSNLVLLIASTIGRFAISDTWIWSRAPHRKRTFTYDVHGDIRVRSPVHLPELAPFAVDRLDGAADIEVAVRSRGFGGLHLRPRVQEHHEMVEYVEQLGAFGFAMRVEHGAPTLVTVSRLVSWSPHVLYTNVLEPLLRWEFVRKGSILAHAACLEIDGVGMLITAKTDTGKTTTCLQSLRTQGSSFLSDDMVILAPDGLARSYPKPLTISAHTMSAVRAAPLSRRRRALLEVQSRIHSKGGRSVGLTMAKWQLPVATMNAITQLVVPPPKFFVEQLLPEAATSASTQVARLLVIERGDAVYESLTHAEACVALAANTEDAYGFPPYPQVGRALSNGDGVMEGRIRAAALSAVPSARLCTPDRNWFERLPALAEPMAHQPELLVPDLTTAGM
jgi:dolichol-phosphate mannosyltransferase